MSGICFSTNTTTIPPGRREKIGFGSGAARCTSACRGVPAGTHAVNNRSGTARYSLFRSASQHPCRENHLKSFYEATVAYEPQYSKTLCLMKSKIVGNGPSFNVSTRNELLYPTREAMALSLRGAHGVSAADRNPSRAPKSTHMHAAYTPAITTDAIHHSVPIASPVTALPRCLSAGSDYQRSLSESSIVSVSPGYDEGLAAPRFVPNLSKKCKMSRPDSGASACSSSSALRGRPCSSTSMRDLWKLTFVPTEATMQSSSEFVAAPSTVQRNTFLCQEYTKKGQLLMRPSSGDSRPDSVYRPVTYMKEGGSLPYSLATMRPFGNLASYNVQVAPRPSSNTFPSSSEERSAPSPSPTSLASERPGSRRECRCPSRQQSSTPLGGSTVTLL